MHIAEYRCPVFMGQQYHLRLTDGSWIVGKLIALDDTVVGLDDVSGFSQSNTPFAFDRALFPLANIVWITPDPAAPTTTTTGYGMQEDA